jgi:LmbE family N-acetylglucosaminyl deacetylase
VSYFTLTDGEAGGFDPAVPRADIPKIRRAEQEKAAAALGVSDVRLLGLPEGGPLHPGREVHVELVRAFRRVRPHRIVTWSPEWNGQRFRGCDPSRRSTRRR